MRFFKAIGRSIHKQSFWLFFPGVVGVTTYGDIVKLGNYEPYQYLILNAVEVFLIFVGISIGYWICYFHLYSEEKEKMDSSEEGH